jgi:ubiquitin-conjugating enzyme (huntingtin interacting protein 2)
LFKKTAQHWAAAFAGAKHKFADFDTSLRKLRDMGVDEHAARVALSSCNWEITKATERLFS